MTINVITSIGTTEQVLTAHTLSELKQIGKKIWLFARHKKDKHFRKYGEFNMSSLLQLNFFENQVTYLNLEGKSMQKIIKELKKDSIFQVKTSAHPELKIDWVLSDLKQHQKLGADIIKIIWTLPDPDWAVDVINRESTRLSDGEYIYQLGVLN